MPRPTRLRSSVETLVRKLSKQNLQHSAASRGSTLSPSPPSSPIPSCPPPQLLGLGSLEPGPSIEIDTFPKPHPAVPAVEAEALPVVDHPLDAGCAIEVDQDEVAGYLVRPSRRHPGLPSDEPMAMRQQEAPILPFTLGPTPRIYEADLDLVPPDADIDMDGVLEVDPAYCNGLSGQAADDEAALLERFRAMRRVIVPGGAVRRSVGGVPLRYRLSADVALGCPNVVRSRPRMRKRPNGDRPKRAQPVGGISTSGAMASTAAALPPHSSITSPSAHPHT